MVAFLFFSKTLALLILWWKVIHSSHWTGRLYAQLILFITPTLFGLVTTALTLYFLPMEIIRIYRVYLYIYSSIYLIILIPQWYRLAWSQLSQYRQGPPKEEYSLLITIIFSVVMILAMVFLFAMYYFWIYSVAGHSQGLLAAQHQYQPVDLDFPTALYFSFVTYFTLGYGDLVPYGFWIRSFVFFECVASVINTGVIIIYVYNFIFASNNEKKRFGIKH